MYIKPALGRVVRDPVLNDYLPAGGRKVDPTIYWNRRIKDGDVVVGSPATVKTERSVSP